MAIVVTTKKINGIVYKYTYSDAGKMIQRDGVVYVDAVDPYGSDRVYTEVEDVNNEENKEHEPTEEEKLKMSSTSNEAPEEPKNTVYELKNN